MDFTHSEQGLCDEKKQLELENSGVDMNFVQKNFDMINRSLKKEFDNNEDNVDVEEHSKLELNTMRNMIGLLHEDLESAKKRFNLPFDMEVDTM